MLNKAQYTYNTGMYGRDRFSTLRRQTSDMLAKAQTFMQRGDYAQAELMCKNALNTWRNSNAPRAEEAHIITFLGKCYEAQRQFQLAYDLYFEALPHLTGTNYDDVYTAMLYVSERMGTFSQSKPIIDEPPYDPYGGR
ncbi:MAG: tetratricopeptide repeat protein [Candidatus Melainabacteria bacterium]|nr:tetratricopeptide repeat protein [Candidatus Melainabacteria bacterium]